MSRVERHIAGNAKSKRCPLDLVQKWAVFQHWLVQKPRVTRVGLVVLGRLLHRQNPKTGRCDPSAIGLMEETGYSVRSIREAYSELEERGAIKRFRVAKRARNQVLIFSVDELRNNERSMELRGGGRTGTTMKRAAEDPAAHCRHNMQRTAPEKEKKKEKKKVALRRATAGGQIAAAKRRHGANEEMNLGEFERRIAKVFERAGLGYEDLVRLPVGEFERAYEQMKTGELTFARTVDLLLEAGRELKSRS